METMDDNPDLPKPRHFERRAAAMLSPAEGFWIAATPVDPDLVDQTFQSIGERSRFYEGSIPPEARARLALLDQMGEGREAEFATPFARAYDAVLLGAGAESKALARRHARLAKMGGVLCAPSHETGLSFIHHPPRHGMHWGSVEILFYASLAMPSHRKAHWKAGKAARARCQELCSQICELMLDGIELAWGLGPALALHRRDGERVHWALDDGPSCQDAASDDPARAALEARQEARQLAQAANPGVCAARRPL